MNQDLLASLHQLRSCRLLIVGDVMLDRYVRGEADRISPEAPVIVLRAEDEEVRLGGAGGVASFARGLGAEVSLATVIGSDGAGLTLRSLCRDERIDTSRILVDATRPTTQKERFIGLAAGRHAHQMLRVDRESSALLSTELASDLIPLVTHDLAEFDAVLIADYAKGVCTRELIAAVIEAAQQCDPPRPVLVDPGRGRSADWYRGATLLKPNRLEGESLCAGQHQIEGVLHAVVEQCPVGFHLPVPSPRLCGERARVRGSSSTSFDLTTAHRTAETIRAAADSEHVVLTLDRDGCVAASRDSSSFHVPSDARTVYDITGAGDMFLAMLGLALGNRLPLETAVRLANEAAGLEVERPGSTPITLDELRQFLTARHSGDKFTTLERLLPRVAEYRKQGCRVVFTNGCFDLLHVGHLALLEEAGQLGDILIVAINSDASVRKLKGAARPIIPEHDRARMLAALGCVDHVLIFDEDTPCQLLHAFQPDVLVKGGTTPHIVGQEIVIAYGGQVVRSGEVPGFSTTALLSRLQVLRSSMQRHEVTP